jgi:CHAT domain-containing protein
MLYNSILVSKNIMEIDNMNQLKSYNWNLIGERLAQDDVAIEFLGVDEFFVTNMHNMVIYAMVIKKNQPPQIIRLFDEKEFTYALTNRNNTVRNVLGKMIWTPIIEEVGEIKDIYFSTTNILAQIPIEHLSINDEDVISDKYNMYRLSTTIKLVNSSSPPRYKNAILYGGLNYEDMGACFQDANSNLRSGFDYLYNTAEEVATIDSILQEKKVNCVTYTGRDGTEMSFKNLSGQDIDILHVATHGLYVKSECADSFANQYNLAFIHPNTEGYVLDEDSVLLRSFLVMAGGNRLIQREDIMNEDGLLTAAEIASLDLRHIDIVSISACESGRGEFLGYDIIGLQRAFKRAGANTIIMSYDKVDDEATKILMVEFYRNLMSGKTKLQSLKDAQKYLRSVEKGKYNKPENWASFIMLDGLN